MSPCVLVLVLITVDGPGSAPSYITYRLPDSPPFIIANVIYRGVAGGEWAANGGYDPNDRTVWLGTRPKVLSRWIHGEAYLDKDRIDAPEVQITLHAMPFRTSGEVIRFLCYVAGSKPGKD
ncbi:hypothetical protein AAVH_20219 [Aphelenchoides avenae]|nr:hypothetical protein AAVH_20219 [Aphelenchus avenae]